jgi:hypothetical protein
MKHTYHVYQISPEGLSVFSTPAKYRMVKIARYSSEMVL